MKPNIKPWQLLSISYNDKLQDTLLQQYHAAQFLAIAGRYLIPQQADDSNTSLVFLPEKQELAGQELQTDNRLVLNLSDFSLGFLKKDTLVLHEISLQGKSKSEVYDILVQILNKEGIKTGNLKNKLHYDLLDHELLHGAVFKKNDTQFIQEHIGYRHNAQLILEQIAGEYPKAERVRVWPHHFDTGSIIPVRFDDQGAITQSMGIGWAIPDSMINEPYFYLSFWSAKPSILPENMPALTSGEWMIPEWNGGVLRLSEILRQSSPEGQYASVRSFFTSGLLILEQHLNP